MSGPRTEFWFWLSVLLLAAGCFYAGSHAAEMVTSPATPESAAAGVAMLLGFCGITYATRRD
jgi:hypothetical protein